MVETVILQTRCTRRLKIEDIPFTQHHLGHPIQTMINVAFTIDGHRGQVNSFIALIHMNTQIMSFMHHTLQVATGKNNHMPGEQFMRAICCHPS